MKNCFFLGLLAGCFLAAGCQSKSYKIEGQGDGIANGDTLYLTQDMETGVPSDTIVVKDNEFELSGTTDSTFFAMIYSAKRNDINIPLFVEPGTIKVNLSKNPGQSKVSGTDTNEKWQTLNDSVVKIGAQINRIATYIYTNQLTASEQKDQMAAIERLNQQFNAFITGYARKNINNEMGCFILTYYPEDVISNKDKLDMIGKMPKSMRNRASIKSLEQTLKEASRYDVGKRIDDFRMKDLGGKERGMMDIVRQHSLTVIDFWASWCGPCRSEMPSMVEMHKKFSGRGLGIVGVSLDEEKDNWATATKQLGITWPQLSDLKGWKNEAAKMFNVTSIPFTVVVDKEGTILAKGLRGKQLADFIESHL